MKNLLVIICVVFYGSDVLGLNVMILTPASLKSLQGIFTKLANGLANNGHRVTFVTSYDVVKAHESIETVITHDYKILDNPMEYEKDIIYKLNQVSTTVNMFLNRTKLAIDLIWSNTKMLSLYKQRNDYDIIMMMSYLHEAVLPFLSNFTGHFVQVVTPGIEPDALTRQGNLLSPAVTPSLISNYLDEMTFFERFQNLPYTILYRIGMQYLNSHAETYIRKYIHEYKNSYNYYERVSLTLINGHFALDGAYPLLPNQIQIGPLNVKEPEPLPKELQEFMDEADDVVYISLGSIIKFDYFPKFLQETFIETIKRMPHIRFVWKFPKGSSADIPSNVYIEDWMPQQDILGHPKTRLFVSHCGNLGMQEAKYHGVPVLGVPIFFDQPRNGARVEKQGMAIMVNWQTLTAEQLVDTINIMLKDKTYKENMMAVSKLLKDQYDDPVKRAVWWMEYIVRHNDPPQLKYAGRKLSLVQYLMLDVIAAYLVILILIVLLIYSLIKFILRKILSLRTKTVSKKVKNSNLKGKNKKD